MKHHKFLLTVVTALGLPALAPAITLNEAQVTSIVKDVKTIDPGKGSRPAQLKETLAGEQSMRTGIESRSELLFNDHTITRLGANTHFSFTEGTRNMSLDSGVMLLQVPKGIGGAKIQTAAVTAAVTGTTIMIEAGKDYTKLIVLEGKCCLWPKNKKLNPNGLQSKLSKMKHEVCAEAGQEIILRNGDTEVPPPVYVNLKTLENTSLLLNGQWGAQINNTPINAAADGQGPDDYNPTNLAIVGAGTDVIIIQQQDPPGLPGTPPATGNPPGTPPGTPPGKYGPLITITSANPYTIGAGSAINTDPTITTGGVTDYGRIYRGNTLDGAANPYLFGAAGSVGITDGGLNDFFTNPNSSSYPYFPNYGVAAFKFQNLNLNGLPSFNMSTNGANDLALIAEGNININAPGVLDFTSFNDLAFATVNGSINLGPDAIIQGLSGNLGFYARGAKNSITVDGVVNLPNGGFFAHSEGGFGGVGTVTAQTIDIKAGAALTLDESQDSEGNTTVDSVNGVQIAFSQNSLFTPLESLHLSGNGITVTNGFTATPPDAEADPFVDLVLNSTNNGTLLGDINLSGEIFVNSFDAYADNNITADSSVSIQSSNEVYFSAGGDVVFHGNVSQSSDFTAQGNNVTLSSDGSITADNTVLFGANTKTEVDGSVTVNNFGGSVTATGDSVLLGLSSNINVSGILQLTGGSSIEMDGTVAANADGEGAINANGGSVTTGSASHITTDAFTITSGASDVTLDGYISVGTLSITGNNINTLSTITTTDSINASESITFNATNNVTFDGSINTPSLTGTAGGALTVKSTATISSDSTSFTAHTLVLNGAITGNDDPATFFGATTTGGAGDVSGTGTIDAQTISFNSAGDLNLDPVASLPDTVNGIGINPNGNLVELDLTGATVELAPSAGFNPSILRATATGGNLTVGSPINVGEFDGTAIGNHIVLTGSGTAITASGTINLAAGEILNQTGTSGNPVAVLTGTAATSLSLAVGTNATLTQTDGASSFVFVQSGTGGNPIVSGTVPFMLSGSGSSPTLSVSANSLTVSGTVDGSTFSSFALNLASATDINGGTNATSATIKGATSVGLQVGVGATIVGSGSTHTIDYNGTQLIIDSTRLSSFSLGAASILVSSGSGGFPGLSGALSLTSSGTDGITINTGLTVGGTATFTANGGGDISINNALNAGTLTVTSSGSTGITTNDIVTVTGTASFTATNGGSINLNNELSAGAINLSADSDVNTVQLSSDGSVQITAGNSISITGDLGTMSDSGTFPIGGDVTLTATNGNVSVTGDNVIISGALTMSASNGSVTLGNGESYLSIGSGVTLYAGTTVSVANDVNLSGPLSITAGTDILATGESAIFFGATDVTLALTDAAAAISQSTDGTLLNFGAAGDSVDGMIGVDLSGSTVSSVNAAGTSITLSGSFNVPVDLSLTATSGTVTIAGSGTVNASSFTGNAANGDIVIGESLVLTGAFSGTAGGNLVINAPVSGDTFSGNASNIAINSTVSAVSEFNATTTTGSIAGTGSVSSPNVSLTQESSQGTVTQSGSQSSQNQFSFNTTLTIALVSSGSFPTPSLTLEAAPLEFASDLTLNNTNLTLHGAVNANGHTITAKDVTLNLSTVTDGSGNASNLTVTGNDSVTIYGASLQGADSTKGSGGILTANTTNFDLNVYGNISASGGSAGGSGGTVSLTAQQSVTIGSEGGAEIDANGGSGSGKGGTINLTANTGDVDLNDFSSLNANGGDASSPSAKGGDGGTINLTAKQGDVNVGFDTHISATSGRNGTSTFPGGAGGAVNLVAQGAVNIDSYATIQVSSSDLVNNRVSAAPGNINVTSHASTGTAINVASTAQLNSILNQAAVGPGGVITFTADKGGDIVIAGTVRADHGTVNITNSGTASGNISLAGATLSGDVVKAQTLSPNGTLTIGSTGNTRISADTAIKLYAQGANGSVDFVGDTYLSGNSIKSIAGQTVTIENGVNVNVLGGAATVYTTTANYTGSGGNASKTGQFTGNTNTTTKPFASRPAF